MNHTFPPAHATTRIEAKNCKAAETITVPVQKSPANIMKMDEMMDHNLIKMNKSFLTDTKGCCIVKLGPKLLTNLFQYQINFIS